MFNKGKGVISLLICLILTFSMVFLYGCKASDKSSTSTSAKTTTQPTVESTLPASYTYINNTNANLGTYAATTSSKKTTVITAKNGSTVFSGTVFNSKDHTTVKDGSLTLTAISLAASGINLQQSDKTLIDNLQFKISYDYKKLGSNSGNIVLYVVNKNKISKTYKFSKSDVSIDVINQTDSKNVEQSTWITVKANEKIKYNSSLKYILNIPKDTVRYKNGKTANQALSFAVYSPDIVK